jgi:hypothetical protein
MDHQNHNPERDKLDQLLENSLGQYSQSEPLTGLEDRILARLEDAAKTPQPAWWSAWFTAPRLAGVVTALLLLAGLWLGMKLVTSPGEDIDYIGQNTTVEVDGGIPAETKIAQLPPRIPMEVIRKAFERRPLPAGFLTLTQPSMPTLEPVKAEVFPAPAPLTEQERLAVAYARRTQQLLTAEVRLPEPGIREMEMAPVVIAPLQVEELEKKSGTGTNTNK